MPKCSVDDCLIDARKRGFCTKHYTRWRNHGTPLFTAKAPSGDLHKWILAHVSHNGDECLIWPYGRYPNGYGQIVFERKGTTANRVMCMEAHGRPLAEDMDAAHSCGNGHLGCVNPKHLRWATRKLNMHDAIQHGTTTRGTRHAHVLLSEAQVLSIYRQRKTRAQTQRQIAEEFGVSTQAIADIENGRRWAWLTKAA